MQHTSLWTYLTLSVSFRKHFSVRYEIFSRERDVCVYSPFWRSGRDKVDFNGVLKPLWTAMKECNCNCINTIKDLYVSLSLPAHKSMKTSVRSYTRVAQLWRWVMAISWWWWWVETPQGRVTQANTHNTKCLNLPSVIRQRREAALIGFCEGSKVTMGSSPCWTSWGNTVVRHGASPVHRPHTPLRLSLCCLC